MKKKILSVVLAALMIISILPVTVFAAEEEIKCPGQGNAHTLDNCTAEVEAVVAGSCSENGHYDGFTIYECKSCHDHFADSFVEAEHEWKVTTKAKAATCTADGTTAIEKCDVCDATRGGEAIPATGHDFEIVEATGDCEHPGKIVSKCKNCGKDTTKEVGGNGHKWSEHPTSIEKEPTHTTTGIAVYTCQNEGCNATKKVDIKETKAHGKVVKVDAVEASCKTPGTKEHWKCLECGKLFSDEKCENETTLKALTVKKVGHDKELIHHEMKPATCTATGTKEYWECEVCGKYYSDANATTEIAAKDLTIKKLAHDYQPDKTIAPTCTEKGFDQEKCSVCGEIRQINETAALGHTEYDDTESTNKDDKPATCTMAGVRYWKCGRCGEAQLEKTDDPTGHTAYDDATSTDKVEKKATCTEDGERTWKCGTCGAELSEVIPATGHTAYDDATSTDKKVDKEATCTEDGKRTWKCGTCEAELSEVIPALGHTAYGDTESKDAVTKAATCTEDGKKTWKCGRCDAEFEEIIAAEGHNFVETSKTAATCIKNGVIEYKCSKCDATDKKELVFDPTKTYKSFTTAAKDHPNLKAEHMTEKKAATCSAAGYEKYKCPDCLAVVTVTLKKVSSAHSWEKVAAVAATCEKDGTIEHEKCEYCGLYRVGNNTYKNDKDDKKAYAAAIRDPKTGHDYRMVKSRIVSCEEFGYELWQCQNPGCTSEYIDNYVRATGHAWKKDTINSKAATCTEKGLEVKYCTNGCGEREITEVDALGHKNNAGKVLEDSCMNTEKDRKCDKCGITIGQSHNNEVDITVEATCKNYKYDLRMCNDCHKAINLNIYKAEGFGEHSYTEWTVAKEPTADEEGEETRKCEVCGNVETRKIATTAAINASFEIDNAAKTGAAFTDSALVAVKLALNTANTDVWGMSFAVNYDKDVVKFEKFELLSEKLNTNAIAHDDENGTVKIFAQAPNSDDKAKQNVTLDGKEEFGVLYFRISSKDATETEFSFGTIEALTFENKSLRVDGASSKIDIQKFLDANADGDVNMVDLLLVYKMTIGAVETTYDSVVDVNKDGVINTFDLLAIYEYYVGAKDYDAMIALRP